MSEIALTDEQMAKLEADHNGGGLTDEQMANLELSHSQQSTGGSVGIIKTIYENHPMLYGVRKGAEIVSDLLRKDTGAKEAPLKSDLYNGDANRIKYSFADYKGAAKKLIQMGYVDVAKDKNGNIIAKDKDGLWHRDADNFIGHPINWTEARVGHSLPLIGGIVGGGSTLETGPGAIAGAAAGGAAGEGARIGIGKLIGVNDADAGDVAIDVGKEALTQGVARAAAPIIQKGLIEPLAETGGEIIRNTGDLAKSVALKMGRSHFRPTMATGARLGEEGIDRAVQESLDTGAIKAGQTVKQTAGRLADEIDNLGAQKGDIIIDATEKGAAIDPGSLISSLERDAANVDKSGVNASEASGLRRLLVGLKSKYLPKNPAQSADSVYAPIEIPSKIPLTDADQIAIDLGRKAYSTARNPALGRLSPTHEGLQGMQKTASNAVEQEVERVLPQRAEEFTGVKRAFGALKDASKMANRTANLQDGGLGPMVMDKALWAEALSSAARGNPIPLLAIPIRFATKGRVSSTGAVMMDKAAKYIAANPQAFEKFVAPLSDAAARGGNALAATQYMISKSPEYQQMIKEVATSDDSNTRRPQSLDKIDMPGEAQKRFIEAQ